MSRIGVERRRSRLQGKDGRTLLLAIDHGLPAGPIPGIERPAELLRRVASVPFSGLIVNPGLVPLLSNEIPPEWGLIVHLSAGTLLGSRPTSKVLGSTVEHALSMGADAVYAGVVGYLSLNGNLDTAIAIRTLFADGPTYYMQAGAGIVADSDPGREWMETEQKLEGLRAALREAAA